MPPFINEKYYPMLFTLNVCFTNQQRCDIRNVFIPFTIFWSAWTSFCIQMSKPTMSKLKCTHFLPRFHKIDHIYYIYLNKFIWYTLPSRRAIATTSLSGALTVHSFRLNCTFNPFDKKRFTKSKFACNMDTWRYFYMFPYDFVFDENFKNFGSHLNNFYNVVII